MLQKMGIEFLWVSRKKTDLLQQISYKDLDEKIMQTHTLVVNSTPLGMFPKTETCPEIPYEFIGPEHYLFDLVYNPEKTVFLKKGESAGSRIKNGSDMLSIQAEASWTIWNSSSGR